MVKKKIKRPRESSRRQIGSTPSILPAKYPYTAADGRERKGRRCRTARNKVKTYNNVFGAKIAAYKYIIITTEKNNDNDKVPRDNTYTTLAHTHTHIYVRVFLQHYNIQSVSRGLLKTRSKPGDIHYTSVYFAADKTPPRTALRRHVELKAFYFSPSAKVSSPRPSVADARVFNNVSPRVACSPLYAYSL